MKRPTKKSVPALARLRTFGRTQMRFSKELFIPVRAAHEKMLAKQKAVDVSFKKLTQAMDTFIQSKHLEYSDHSVPTHYWFSKNGKMPRISKIAPNLNHF